MTQFTVQQALELAQQRFQTSQFSEAIAICRQVVQAQPQNWVAHNLLGAALLEMGHATQAEQSFRSALQFHPDGPDILANVGTALRHQLRVDESVAAYRRAISLAPQFALAHFNLGIALAQKGELAEGFAEMERRWQVPELRLFHQEFPQPRWDGSPLNGRRILIRGEQGFGDSIQFARYVELVTKRAGGRVILAVRPELSRLFRSLSGVVEQFMTHGDPLVPFDVHSTLISLPAAFKTSLATIPNQVPYLKVDPMLVEQWRARIDPGDGSRKIGIVWAGASTFARDAHGPLNPAALAPLMAIPQTRFFSLQKNDVQRGAVPLLTGMTDWSEDLRDFADTAALIECLDLVISVDTSVAHLAGAMGKPVWVLLPWLADWRWMLNRTDSPWYPTMRLFRQPSVGDWHAPIQQMKHELRRELVSKSGEAAKELLGSHRQSGRLEEACAQYRALIAAGGAHLGETYFNLGNVLRDLGRPDEAIDAFREVVRLHPDSSRAWVNLGFALHEQGSIEDAITANRKALEISPAGALGHLNLAVALLLSGQLREGWIEYEWRARVTPKGPTIQEFPQPRWDGGPLNGRTILLHAEQGLGDTIQFVRYAKLVAQQGGRVVLQCHPEIFRLLQNLAGVDQVFQHGQPLPQFDVHCPLMSLPLVMGTTIETIPAEIPYLRAEPEQSAYWGARLATEKARRIGVAWTGAKANPRDKARSIAPLALAPIVQVHHTRLFSLQKDDVKTGSDPSLTFLTDWTEDLGDFAETAALIENLDLIVTVDTAVAHLAGAMGKPVWLLLPFIPDWRWMLGRNDSPWYPTMRLFRQPKPGDWETPIGRIVQELAQ